MTVTERRFPQSIGGVDGSHTTQTFCRPGQGILSSIPPAAPLIPVEADSDS